MSAEELTQVLLQNQQKTNEMLAVVVKDVGGLGKEIAVLSTKLAEKEKFDQQQETKRKQDIKDLEDHIKEVEIKTDDNTDAINKIKGGWGLILFLVSALSIAATIVTFVWRH